MKINKIIIIAFILVAVFTIGQVSAQENITEDNLTSEIPQEDLNLSDEEIIADEFEDSVSEVNESQIANEINVEFDEQMWCENLTDIKVDFPQNASGQFCLKINDEVIYNQTITNKSIKIPVKLPKDKFMIIVNIWPPYDYDSYKVSAFYNDIELKINNTLKIMKYPPECVLWGNFPLEILQYDDYYTFRYNFIIPRSANGDVEVYVDGKRINATNRAPYIEFNSSEISNLDLGIHNITFKYFGDKYYLPANRTFEFNVTNVLISIPKTVNISHDDCISVDVLRNTSGTVYVYLDNDLIYTGQTEKGNFILSLEKYLKCNSKEVKVVFVGKHYTRTKVVPIDVVYDFDIWGSSFVYGEDNVVEIMMPDYLNNSLLHVDINGVNWKFTHPSNIMNNLVELDVSKLLPGNYTLFVSYPGDDKFVAKNKTFNFTVRYSIISPYNVDYGDGSVVYLNLPSNATGKLSVYIGGVLYKSVKMKNGVAKIRVDDLAPGVYNLNITYVGDDYEVEPSLSTIIMSPSIKTDEYYVIQGKDSFINLKVPESCKGYAVFKIDKKEYKVAIKNGIAKLNLKDFKTGEHDIDIYYYGADGYNDSYCRYFDVGMPTLKIVSLNAYSSGVVAKIKAVNIDNKPVAGLKLTVTFNGKKYAVKTNAKGIATFKKSMKLEVKKYKLTAQYKKVKVSKKVKAKHVLGLKTVKVKKSASKLILKAVLKEGKTPLKNKSVSFKFNGKTYKAKTNKKGIAKVTVKNSALKKLKVGKRITYVATYLKDTVKRTVKVKK